MFSFNYVEKDRLDYPTCVFGPLTAATNARSAISFYMRLWQFHPVDNKRLNLDLL